MGLYLHVGERKGKWGGIIDRRAEERDMRLIRCLGCWRKR